MNQTIEISWRAYREEGVRPGASAVEVKECRRAYYAGAHAILMKLIVHSSHASSLKGSFDMLMALDEELNTFNQEVAEGRA